MRVVCVLCIKYRNKTINYINISCSSRWLYSFINMGTHTESDTYLVRRHKDLSPEFETRAAVDRYPRRGWQRDSSLSVQSDRETTCIPSVHNTVHEMSCSLYSRWYKRSEGLSCFSC